MVGRFGRKVGRYGEKSRFFLHIYRLAEEIFKKKEKMTFVYIFTNLNNNNTIKCGLQLFSCHNVRPNVETIN